MKPLPPDDVGLAKMRLVVLPKAEADALDELIDEALDAADPEGESERAWRRYQEDLANELSAMAESSDHLWHFLDGLGRRLLEKKQAQAEGQHRPLKRSPGSISRGILLLHGLLRSCSANQESDVCSMLLSTSTRKDRPSLDLPRLARRLHYTVPAPSTPSSAAAATSASAGDVSDDAALAQFAHAYCVYLQERLRCVDSIGLQVFRTGAKSATGEAKNGDIVAENCVLGNSESDSERGLGEAYWVQLQSDAVLHQVASLQQLQQRLVDCAAAAPSGLGTSFAARKTAAGTAGGANGGAGGRGREGEGKGERERRRRVVRYVLEVALDESFRVYGWVNYGLIELMERLSRFPKEQAMRALQVCQFSVQQGKALSDMYTRLGAAGVGAGVAFPSVAVLGDGVIGNLSASVAAGPDAAMSVPPSPMHSAAAAAAGSGGFSRAGSFADGSAAGGASFRGQQPGHPQFQHQHQQQQHHHHHQYQQQQQQQMGYQHQNPQGPSPYYSYSASQPPPPQPASPALSPAAQQQQFDDTAQALFGSYSSQPSPAAASNAAAQMKYLTNGAQGWERALDDTAGAAGGASGGASGGVAGSYMPPRQQGQGGQHAPHLYHQHHQQQQHQQQQQWALAAPGLNGGSGTAGSSPLDQPPMTAFSGGWDQLLLDSLYEAAQAQKHASDATAARLGGAGGSGVGAGAAAAVGGIGGAIGDPFAASAAVPPPPYVQMALRAQQQLAMELQRRMLSQHARFFAAARSAGGADAMFAASWMVQQKQMQVYQQQQYMARPGGVVVGPSGPYNWNGVGVQYGNVLIPF
ncbi:unnamed protein product [Closterium sp. NIES-64]|nr:unnamed protein product [Closterium sp. NIES-64]